MIALGIDPGTRNLGWGVVERTGQRLVHIAHGVIRLPAAATLSVRLLEISSRLDEVILHHRPKVGSVEGIFFDKNAQSAAKLGHARGVVLLGLERRGVLVREHAPAKVKRALAGNGQAEKGQVARMVAAVLGLRELPPADAADALALAITELRLDPRARVLEDRQQARGRLKVPPHLAEAIRRARASRG
jgi:crossover junction endodeoxyribonuclease RuvC